MKLYKIRFNCASFLDVVVSAGNKEEAIEEAQRVCSPCPQDGMEFSEFLSVEDGDQPEN